MRKERTMLKVRTVAILLGFAFLLPLVSGLWAQAPAAPIPVQVLTAKKVFISNIGNDHYLSVWSGGSDRLYNTFYAALKSCGHYEIVAAPADSDLVLEVKVVPSSVVWQLKLELLDPKTRIVLWAQYEPLKITASQKTRDKDFDDSINKLVGDLKALTAQPAAAAK
jgi:hypothetical protein